MLSWGLVVSSLGASSPGANCPGGELSGYPPGTPLHVPSNGSQTPISLIHRTTNSSTQSLQPVTPMNPMSWPTTKLTSRRATSWIYQLFTEKLTVYETKWTKYGSY